MNRLGSRWLYLALSLGVAVLWFATLPLRPLFNTDEGRYAEIPREMLSGGDWIIPHLNGLAYIEKPPLQYWATALSLAVWGPGEFAARFYTALCALGAVLAVGLAARRLWASAAAAVRSAAMLASMLLFLIMGQIVTLDMSLTFYMSVALGAFLAAQAERRPEQVARERGLMLLAWSSTALGVLTKGPVAAAIPAAVLVLYSLYTQNFTPWRRLHFAAGVPLFLCIAAPWYLLATGRLPDFLEFFFVHEHVARYLTPSANRQEVWWFFGPVVVLGSLPWTVPAIRAMCDGWRRPARGAAFDPALFLRIWVLFVIGFFSLSDSKLIPYILPVFPALALLLGSMPEDILQRDLTRTAVITLCAAIALVLLRVYAPAHLGASERGVYFLSLGQPLAWIAAVLAVSALYILSKRKRDVTQATVLLSVGWCLAGLLVMRAAAAVAPIYSGVQLARALPVVPRDAPVYSVGTYDQTLPFYWRRTVTLVAYRGELDYGLTHDPGALLSMAQFLQAWNGTSQAYAVMEISMFDELKHQGTPMHVLARDVNRILVARE